ncbi:hypothetical protein C8J56DRAFT_432403 [Mycena floridula]|nr:hypothetical protein C8J56DRAFT_432403 [Mycena floridula]
MLVTLPFLISVLATHAFTIPNNPTNVASVQSRINVGLEDVLLFDSLAFQNPDDSSDTLASLQSFVFLKEVDTDKITGLIKTAFSLLGVNIGDKIAQILDRAKLFAAIGMPNEDVSVSIDGCSTPATLSDTSAGMVLANVSFGQCGSSTTALSSAITTDNTIVNGTMFFSPPDGFGVISDIDDTVKISNVLNKLKLLEATFLDSPTPVAGMPDLYASLETSLKSPQFIYVSGSPFQLYPFLHDFIGASFPKGPILLRNLTITDLSSLLSFTSSDGVFEYKSAMIDRIKGIYPAKKFLVIGDSTEKDPETYGEAFRKYGDFITCIWIHQVDGADNTPARFAEAFDSVPTNKFRIYTDADIPSLSAIDVAGGAC